MKTAQRNTILNYLKNDTSHPTAKEIYMGISQKEKDSISLATVYNTIALMKKRGMVREIAIPDFDQKRYDPNVVPHPHLICRECGRIEDVFFPVHIGIPDEYKQGFSIQENEINFYGLCPRCKTKDKEPAPGENTK